MRMKTRSIGVVGLALVELQHAVKKDRGERGITGTRDRDVDHGKLPPERLMRPASKLPKRFQKTVRFDSWTTDRWRFVTVGPNSI